MLGSASSGGRGRRLPFPNDRAQQAEEFFARRDWNFQSRPRFLGRFARAGERFGLALPNHFITIIT